MYGRRQVAPIESRKRIRRPRRAVDEHGVVVLRDRFALRLAPGSLHAFDAVLDVAKAENRLARRSLQRLERRHQLVAEAARSLVDDRDVRLEGVRPRQRELRSQLPDTPQLALETMRPVRSGGIARELRQLDGVHARRKPLLGGDRRARDDQRGARRIDRAHGLGEAHSPPEMTETDALVRIEEEAAAAPHTTLRSRLRIAVW